MQEPSKVSSPTSGSLPADFRLTVIYRPTNSIFPDPGNAGTHSGKQVAEIGVSIKSNGFTNPILIFSSAEYCLRVARRMSFTTCSDVICVSDLALISVLRIVTMNQKSSVVQVSQSVP